jgi:hypothetical protein
MSATNKYAAETHNGTIAETPEGGNNSAAINPPLTIAPFTTTS